MNTDSLPSLNLEDGRNVYLGNADNADHIILCKDSRLESASKANGLENPESIIHALISLDSSLKTLHVAQGMYFWVTYSEYFLKQQ
jgi:hypothetical protein